MSDSESSNQPKNPNKIGPIGWILFPLLPVRLLCRWMYQDVNIRGELLGALIVACLVMISAVTGFIFGDQEDRRLSRELELSLFSAQSEAMKDFADGIPKNLSFLATRKQPGLQASYFQRVEGVPGLPASNIENIQVQKAQQSTLELELRREWLTQTTHYVSLSRGIEAQFESWAVIDAVQRTEQMLSTLQGLELRQAGLREAIEDLRSLLTPGAKPQDWATYTAAANSPHEDLNTGLSLPEDVQARAMADLDMVEDMLDALPKVTDSVQGAVDKMGGELEAAQALVRFFETYGPELYTLAVQAMSAELGDKKRSLEDFARSRTWFSGVSL